MTKAKPVLETLVWCTLRFEAYHWWENAPPTMKYLKEVHRHIFHVKAGVKVTSDDREVEFIELKHKVTGYVQQAYAGKTFSYSCEQIAKELLQACRLSFCEVSEDGENGATVVAMKG